MYIFRKSKYITRALYLLEMISQKMMFYRILIEKLYRKLKKTASYNYLKTVFREATYVHNKVFYISTNSRECVKKPLNQKLKQYSYHYHKYFLINKATKYISKQELRLVHYERFSGWETNKDYQTFVFL